MIRSPGYSLEATVRIEPCYRGDLEGLCCGILHSGHEVAIVFLQLQLPTVILFINFLPQWEDSERPTPL